MGKKYLLNMNSKRIHDISKADGRCKIKTMKPECVIYLDTLDEAENYPDPSRPLAKTCRFCISNKTELE